MRLLRFEDGGRAVTGIRVGDSVVPAAAVGLPDDPVALLAPGMRGRAAEAAAAAPASARVARSGLKPLMPIARPGKVICIGLNYALHAKEGGNPIPDYPAVFLRVQSSLVGPDQPMLRPAGASTKLDYEAELAVVIGSRARCVAEAEALAHVGAYSLFNDGSVRDYQRKSTQWTMGKNFDATGAFGPELVTPDELPEGAAPLRITSRVDGQTVQDSTTGDMIFPVARCIAILSEVMTLEPGDVIATGTPSGVGYARKPPLFLAPGMTVEVEVEGIGVLRNTVADDPAFAG